MHLVADIGGTSSRWVFPAMGIASLVKLKGYNPVAQGRHPGFVQGLDVLQPKSVTELTIYGAGCGNDMRQLEVKEKAAQVFKNASISVYSDLLAVGHALLGNEPGTIAILGTGMNVARYDGHALVQKVPSLGYLIGDEGSGAYIGKRFLHDFFNRRVPVDLIVKVFPQGNPTLANTLKEVYGDEAQNRAMASYVTHLAPFADHPYVNDLVRSSFQSFMDLILEHHDESELTPFAISGGVAHGFSGILREVLNERGANDVRISSDPLEGLLAYYAFP